MPTPSEWLVLLAGLLAGAINAIAGGGTMLTFPALLAAGLPPVIANTTSTVALWFGMPGSVWSFRRRLSETQPWIIPLGLVSLLGGALGAWLLLALPESIFDQAVPWLLLLATLLFLLNEPLRRTLRHTPPSQDQTSPKLSPRALAFQAVVAVYGGYFGAGIGIMMLAALGLLGLRDIHRMNALKNLLGLLCNTAAMLYFLINGSYDLRLGLHLLGGSIPGYFIGSHYSQKIPQKIVRLIVAAVGICITADLFWKQFHPVSD